MSFRACCCHCLKPYTKQRHLHPCMVCKSFALCSTCAEKPLAERVHRCEPKETGTIDDYRWFRLLVDNDEFLKKIVAATVLRFHAIDISRENDVIMIKNNVNREVPCVIQFGQLFLEAGKLDQALDIAPQQYVRIDVRKREIKFL